MTDQAAKPSRRQFSFLLVLLAGTMGVNVFLALRIHNLELRSSNGPLPIQNAILGEKVLPFHISNIDGTPVTLDFTSTTQPTVLYVLNPKCHWCSVNEDNVKELTRLAGSRFRFVGLSLDDGSLRAFIAAHNLGMPVFRLPSYDLAPGLALGGTPETIVVSKEGKVVRVWLGAFSGSALSEVESYFSAKLPGLKQESVSRADLP